MSTRPAPARRYLDEPEQHAYEAGWRQMHDHDSFRTLEWIEGVVATVNAGEAERCRRRAAALFGAADALAELAERQLDGAVFAADLDGGDLR